MPVLMILVVITIVALWFLCSSIYKPLGRFFGGIINDAKDAIDDNKNDDEKENNNNE